MIRINLKNKNSKWISSFILGIIVIINLLSCGNQVDKLKASSWNGSVEIVEIFLKKQYLRDPESYKSVEWGKLIKISDGSFQVSHTFRAKNGFGGVNTKTILFCISNDGKNVHICNQVDEEQMIISEQIVAIKKFIESNFSDVLFEGILSENIDGISEKSTFKGKLTKNNRKIEGNLFAVEKETKYFLTGEIGSEGEISLKLQNFSNNLIIQMNGYVEDKKISASSAGTITSFYLTQAN